MAPPRTITVSVDDLQKVEIACGCGGKSITVDTRGPAGNVTCPSCGAVLWSRGELLQDEVLQITESLRKLDSKEAHLSVTFTLKDKPQ